MRDTAIFQVRLEVPKHATIGEAGDVEEFLHGVAYPVAIGKPLIEAFLVSIEVPVDTGRRKPFDTWGEGYRFATGEQLQALIDEGEGLSFWECGYYVAQRVSEINGELASLGWNSVSDPERVR